MAYIIQLLKPALPLLCSMLCSRGSRGWSPAASDHAPSVARLRAASPPVSAGVAQLCHELEDALVQSKRKKRTAHLAYLCILISLTEGRMQMTKGWYNNYRACSKCHSRTIERNSGFLHAAAPWQIAAGLWQLLALSAPPCLHWPQPPLEQLRAVPVLRHSQGVST